MNALTLKYGADERALADWGIALPRLELLSQAPSTITFPVAGADPSIILAFEIPYKGQCSVYMDRVLQGDQFTGGKLIFQGRRSDIEGNADPAKPGLVFALSDPWWDLEQTFFQHEWRIITNIVAGVPTYAMQLFAKCNLFQDISAGPNAPWTTLSTDDQIAEIITFAASAGANIQLGTCDPAWNLPVFPVNTITCAAAILHCLSLVPNAVTFFDYTTTPPTLHIRQRPNCTPVTFPFGNGPTTDGSPMHKGSPRIRPLPQLQTSQVVLQYYKSFNFDGAINNDIITDAYPPRADGKALGAIVAGIDLRGGILTQATGTITAAAIDPTTAAFWQTFKPDLRKAAFDPNAVEPGSVTVTDESTGQDITADWAGNWPRAIVPLQSTGAAPWMPIQVKDVTIAAKLNYRTQAPIGATTTDIQHLELHPVSVRLALTNSPLGTETYSTISHYDPGETPPGFNEATQDFRTPGAPQNDAKGGLAYLIWQSMQQLQYEATHNYLQESITQVTQNDITGKKALLSPGNVLNLAGGDPSWANMDAVIKRVTFDFFRGKTEIAVGPEARLGPADIVRRVLLWRFRTVYDDPNIRNTGQPSGSSSIALQNSTPKENTNSAAPFSPSLATVLSRPLVVGGQTVQLIVQHDANNGFIKLGYLKADGTDQTGNDWPRLLIRLNDIFDADDVAGDIQVYQARFKDGTGATKDILLACTAPKNPTFADPDFTFGGGGGGMNWKDTYNSATAYSLYDVVRVMSGNSQGIWINVNASGSTGVDPVWPEPVNATWKLITFGPQATNACVSGAGATVYVNASQGF